MTTTITVAFGDGIGPEIMEAALHVLREAEAPLEIEAIEIGKRIYDMDSATGILPSSWDSLLRTKILLKGPTELREGREDVTEVIRRRLGMGEARVEIATDEMNDEPLATACIWENFALFAAAAPNQLTHAGRNKADPSGMLRAATLLLTHIGQQEKAGRIHKAWLKTRAEKLDPARLGTREFAEAIVERLYK